MKHAISEFSLKRINELDRKQPRLLREILRAGPVAGFTRVVGLGQKAADFLYQIMLGRAELLVIYLLKIFFGDIDVVIGLVRVTRLIVGRELRRNLNGGGSCGLLGGRFRDRFRGLFARRGRGLGACWRDRQGIS